ncbi:MAG: hypothetical protein ACREGB_00600 [Candidatus Saccharimonadales bacterium]
MKLKRKIILALLTLLVVASPLIGVITPPSLHLSQEASAAVCTDYLYNPGDCTPPTSDSSCPAGYMYNDGKYWGNKPFCAPTCTDKNGFGNNPCQTPKSQANCPSGYTFYPSPPSNNGVPICGSKDFAGVLTPAICESKGQYFIPKGTPTLNPEGGLVYGGSTSADACGNKADFPKSQADCKAGTTFEHVNVLASDNVTVYVVPACLFPADLPTGPVINGPGDCKAGTYFVKNGVTMPGDANPIQAPFGAGQCESAFEYPRNPGDCTTDPSFPNGYYYLKKGDPYPYSTYSPDLNDSTDLTAYSPYSSPSYSDTKSVPAPHAYCLFKAQYPRNAQDCPSSTYYVAGGGNAYYANAPAGDATDIYARCVSKRDHPRDYTDCTAGTVFVENAKSADNLTHNHACVDTPSTAECNANPDNDGCGALVSASLQACKAKVPVLGWLLCKLIDGMQNAVGAIYDHIINPLLTIEPISTKDKSGAVNPIYNVWKNFRLYSDVFLFIAVLVIVFGEAIGGGLIDAYSAKKMLPRLLIATLLINLSFYLVAVVVDIANVVGNGLADLITAPFAMGGNFNLQVGTAGTVGLATLLAGAVIWAKISLTGQFMAWLWFSILLPLLLIFLAILVTVLLRQILVVFLVIISPVAFALYCLPNTEKYFKKWWDILFETLLVFPIITALFAMGKVSAYLLSHSSSGALSNGLAQIMGVVALVMPLLLIPFSFKIAGGLIGRAHDLIHSGRQKWGLGQATRERIKAQSARNRLQARGSAYAALQKQGSKGGVIRRNTLGRLAKGGSGLLGYNVEAEMSAARAEVGKTLNDQIATGKDEEIRALTVNKTWAAKQWRTDENGNRVNDYMRTDGEGRTQYKTLGGAWVNEADVDRGHARWGRDTFAQQTALSYEMKKAQTEGQLQDLAKNYQVIARGVDSNGNKVGGGWGMSREQAGGAWIGAAFERQNEHLEFKGTNWQTGELNVDKATGLAGGGFVDEVYEKKGSYPVAQMGSNTIEQLKKAHASTVAVLGNSSSTPAARAAAEEQQRKLNAIAETFMRDVGAGSEKRQAGTPGAGHVAERVVEFAQLTGAYQYAPGSQPVGPLPEGHPRNDDPQK